jgi:hypothetical protein
VPPDFSFGLFFLPESLVPFLLGSDLRLVTTTAGEVLVPPSCSFGVLFGSAVGLTDEVDEVVVVEDGSSIAMCDSTEEKACNRRGWFDLFSI